MEDSSEVGVEVRDETMVLPTGNGNPRKRVAHFLKPCVNSINGKVFELPTNYLPSVPLDFEPKNWPIDLRLHGWMWPQEDWKKWVLKMASLHEPTWKKVGINDAIFNSIYKTLRNNDLLLGLAEKWCPQTKSFIFPWGEATITLEDMMIVGYSVLGSPVFLPLETDAMMEVEEKLNRARQELQKSASSKAYHSFWLKRFVDSGSENEHEAFLALWLSRFVFPSRYPVISKSVFSTAIHLARGTRIALAPALLASIYRDLSLLKEKIVALSNFISREHEDSEFANEDCEFATVICSPFQLVQFWACERFTELRPVPKPVKNGEPRFARWHKVKIRVQNVRTVLDSAKESFHWRPYVTTVNNWILPNFLGEEEMLLAIDANSTEELLSYARCLRISKLVGLHCIEQYLPHRVAMQFGMDQDLPACVAQGNEIGFTAWQNYSKPITNANLYISTRGFKAEVSTRYMDWWKQSLSSLQCARVGALPPKRILASSKIAPSRSKGRKKRCFSGLDGKPVRASEMKPSFGVLSSSLSKRSKRIKKRGFTGMEVVPEPFGALGSPLNREKTSGQISSNEKIFVDACASDGLLSKTPSPSLSGDAYVSAGLLSKALPLSLEKVKMEADDSPIPPGFPPKSELLHAREPTENFGLSVAHGFNLKKKSSVQLSDKEKEVGDASAYANLSSEELPLSSKVKKESDNSTAPSSFPLKSNLVLATDSTKKDNMALRDSVESSKNKNNFQGTKLHGTENMTCQSHTCFPLIVDNEAIKIVEPVGKLAERVAKGGLETPREEEIEMGASSIGNDSARGQDSDGDGKNYGSEEPIELEARVIKLQKIVAELKAQRLGLKNPVI